jgi:VIT1/CCC1 family predicted Fe2+/Mn2+ transporter
MSDTAVRSRRVLEPVDRVSEILFGLIMVLTFTGALSVAEAGHEEVREMLIGALGCNLAWGIIDAIFYLMGSLAENGRNLTTYRAVRAATAEEQARRAIADALPPVIASVLEPAEYEALHRRLRALPEAPAQARLGRRDWLGGLGVLLLVFLSIFPVVIPFLVMRSAVPALRASNVIAIAMLFVAGYAYGRGVGWRPWLVGLSMVLLGVLLSALAMALGG